MLVDATFTRSRTRVRFPPSPLGQQTTNNREFAVQAGKTRSAPPEEGRQPKPAFCGSEHPGGTQMGHRLRPIRCSVRPTADGCLSLRDEASFGISLGSRRLRTPLLRFDRPRSLHAGSGSDGYSRRACRRSRAGLQSRRARSPVQHGIRRPDPSSAAIGHADIEACGLGHVPS
jgi:hypothetical protein